MVSGRVKRFCFLAGPLALFAGSVVYLQSSPYYLGVVDLEQTASPNSKGDLHGVASAPHPPVPLKLDSTPIIDTDTDLISPVLDNPPSSSPAEPLKPAPKITLVAVWNPQTHPVEYLPHFFASVGANSAHLELLFIKYDKHRIGCDAPLADGVSNVREVCMTPEEYWAAHADFMCHKWACTEKEKKQVLETMLRRAPGDRVNSFFRPFRAGVFAKFMDPRTPIWGWCDMDVMLGDFGRVFPWDIAHDFDVLLAGPSNDFRDAVMLYLTGHLAFFKHAPHVTDAFLQIPQLQSAAAFQSLRPLGQDTEECEYSHWLLKGVPQLTFLRFPAMVQSRYHISTVGAGVYGFAPDHVWNASAGALLEPEKEDARAALTAAVRSKRGAKRTRAPVGARPTFTDAGHEYEIELREGQWQGHLWCERQFAVDFVIDHAKAQLPEDELFQRYVLRREPNGPVYDRIEPISPHERVTFTGAVFADQTGSAEPHAPSPAPVAFEMLYKHFHHEKYTDWWTMPEHPLRPGEVLYVDQDEGAWAWTKEGRITFDTRTAVQS